MSLFLQENKNLVSVGVGVTLGLSGLVLFIRSQNRMNGQIQALTSSIDSLRTEIKELTQKVDTVTDVGTHVKPKPSTVTFRKHKKPVGYSYITSDDDADFESCGETDLEPRSTGTSEYETGFETCAEMDPEVCRIKHGDMSFVPNELFDVVDRKLEGTDEDKLHALSLLEEKHNSFSTNADFLWRLAKTTFFVSQIEGAKGDVNKQKDMIFKARDHAIAALEMNENNAAVQRWCAITKSSAADYEGTKAKIATGYEFKDHIETAISLDPQDPSAQHLLGRWCFGVYMLTWVERKVAATLFATPPTSTVEEALEHFLEAERLNPGVWKENMLFIAKCYIEQKQYSDAVEWLEKADSIYSVSQDDKDSQKEIEQLLYKYRS